jgi:hypothetical protein
MTRCEKIRLFVCLAAISQAMLHLPHFLALKIHDAIDLGLLSKSLMP